MSKSFAQCWRVIPVFGGAFFFISASARAEKIPINFEETKSLFTKVYISNESGILRSNVASHTHSNRASTINNERLAPEAVNLAQIAAPVTEIDLVRDVTWEPSDEPIAGSMGQVTSVSQLSDVQPTDWAFQALQNLVERYGCLAGYPDSTYRGNRALTRYEFAAGLNACIEKVTELMGGNTADLPTKEDLAILQRLQAEFETELATLRGRVDVLEAHSADLEANQFSTTARLAGEVIFVLGSAFGEDAADGDDNPENNPDLEETPIFADRVRLNFDTSFTGTDRLRVRFQARNITAFDDQVTGTKMTRLAFEGNSDNTFELHRLQYRFQLGDRATVVVDANEGQFYDNIDTLNPLLDSSGSGAISRFGRFNPIYRLAGGAGASIVYKLSNRLNLSLGYLADEASAPNSKSGFFNGPFSALAQLNIQPNERIGLGLTYVRSYNLGAAGDTGSQLANQPFGEVATSANSYGVEASFRVSPRFTLSGWVGLTDAEAQAGTNAGNRATILNWAATLAFPDLGKEGNLAGFVVGMPPKVISSDASEDPNTSFHIEGFYRFQLSDNISITPGFFVILNPEHNDSNATLFMGAIRTTFRF